MITKFIEGSDGGAYGKWVVCRFDSEECQTRSALPEFENQSIFSNGGSRKFRPDNLFVIDLQTGQGAHFNPADGVASADSDLHDRNIWVCPLFPQFLRWLYTQEHAMGDITQLPSYVEFEPLHVVLKEAGSGS